MGRVRNVSGEGNDCLIRALLLAATNTIDELTVTKLRTHLILMKVAKPEEMIELASLGGAVLISKMIELKIIRGNRGLIIYMWGKAGSIKQVVVVEGSNPINLWLSDNHFQAIVP